MLSFFKSNRNTVLNSLLSCAGMSERDQTLLLGVQQSDKRPQHLRLRRQASDGVFQSVSVLPSHARRKTEHWWQHRREHEILRAEVVSTTSLSLRVKCLLLLEGRSRRAHFVQLFLLGCVLLNLVAFALSTEESLSHSTTLQAIEIGTVAVFAFEYVLRCWCSVEDPRYPGRHRFWQHVFSFGALVDLAALIAGITALILEHKFEAVGAWLRVLRVLNIFKADQLQAALRSVRRVLRRNRHVLAVGVIICLVLLVITSVLLYATWGDVDHDRFGSVPRASFYAVMLLTGQGLDNVESLGLWMHVLVAVTSVFSVAIFAVPAAMLAWGFEAEAERLAARSQKRKQLNNQSEIDLDLMLLLPDEDEDGSDDERSDSDSEPVVHEAADAVRTMGLTGQQFATLLHLLRSPIAVPGDEDRVWTYSQMRRLIEQQQY
ncbi:MAG: hypothetical protein MHM6MM_003528 [Cercozoa sp. M6MM]